MNVLVAGALANKPNNGGEAWVRLSWIRGLQAAGAQVTFVEELDPGTAKAEGRESRERRGSIRYFERVIRSFGLEGRSVLLTRGSDRTGESGGDSSSPFVWRRLAGMPLDHALDRITRAELLVNISGHLSIQGPVRGIPRRAYVDLDPGFTQIWWASGVGSLGLADHDTHFTVGVEIGRDRCLIPGDDFRWQPIRQPFVAEDWPASSAPSSGPFTTVASWRGAFGPIEHAGKRYGVKAHEFRKIIELPGRVESPFELAVAMHPEDRPDRDRLLEAGWRLLDPTTELPNPDAFRAFVRRSAAEFSPAQGIYVDTNSGWFSDRTVRYLASGRPALVQDTGFTATLPTGDGLLAYRTLADAQRGVEEIAARLGHHAAAARQIAEEHFEAEAVCSDFLERATAKQPRPAGFPA